MSERFIYSTYYYACNAVQIGNYCQLAKECFQSSFINKYRFTHSCAYRLFVDQLFLDLSIIIHRQTGGLSGIQNYRLSRIDRVLIRKLCYK